MSKKIEALEKRLKALKSKEQDLRNELKRSANIEKEKKAKLEKQMFILLGEYYLDEIIKNDVMEELEAKGINHENFDVTLLHPYSLAEKCLNKAYSFHYDKALKKGRASEKAIQNALSKRAEMKEIFVQRVKREVKNEMDSEREYWESIREEEGQKD